MYSQGYSSVVNAENPITIISLIRVQETIDVDEENEIKSLSIMYVQTKIYLK